MPPPTGLAARAFERAMSLNLENIGSALAAATPRTLLDVGCDDGDRTIELARRAGASEVFGVEAVAERAEAARRRGIEVVVTDLTTGLPYAESTFDAVVSNQVIEHLHDTDSFVSECARVVRPGGVVVTSTENLASWHNLVALLCGWQPFSLTNVSRVTSGLGNPLALYRGLPHTQPETWQHIRVFAYRALRELFEAHGLVVESILGAGYYPLPAAVGLRDPRHAAFITAIARRPSV